MDNTVSSPDSTATLIESGRSLGKQNIKSHHMIQKQKLRPYTKIKNNNIIIIIIIIYNYIYIFPFLLIKDVSIFGQVVFL